MQVDTVIEDDVMTRKGPKMSDRCVFLLDLCRYYLYLIYPFSLSDEAQYSGMPYL